MNKSRIELHDYRVKNGVASFMMKIWYFESPNRINPLVPTPDEKLYFRLNVLQDNLPENFPLVLKGDKYTIVREGVANE